VIVENDQLCTHLRSKVSNLHQTSEGRHAWKCHSKGNLCLRFSENLMFHVTLVNWMFGFSFVFTFSDELIDWWSIYQSVKYLHNWRMLCLPFSWTIKWHQIDSVMPLLQWSSKRSVLPLIFIKVMGVVRNSWDSSFETAKDFESNCTQLQVFP